MYSYDGRSEFLFDTGINLGRRVGGRDRRDSVESVAVVERRDMEGSGYCPLIVKSEKKSMPAKIVDGGERTQSRETTNPLSCPLQGGGHDSRRMCYESISLSGLGSTKDPDPDIPRTPTPKAQVDPVDHFYSRNRPSEDLSLQTQSNLAWSSSKLPSTSLRDHGNPFVSSKPSAFPTDFLPSNHCSDTVWLASHTPAPRSHRIQTAIL
jgi:hypothetical protein